MRGVRMILFISLVALTAESFAQVDTAWVRRYNGPGNDVDLAKALAVDGSGNVYVTGGSGGSTSNYDYATIKYSSVGDTLWVRRYNGPGSGPDIANALAVDGSGNVYVTGASTDSSGDYATIKYSSAGNTVWIRRYGSPGFNFAQANALAVDGSGNVYVTGSRYDLATATDYATIKYNSVGDTLWVRRYNGPGIDGDVAYAIAVDGSGNVYVTGYSDSSGTSYDYATIKYAANGDTLWLRRYNGPGNGFDGAYALAVDGSGNVYVTGFSPGSGTNADYATIKYSSVGDTLWVRRYNGPGNNDDVATALAVDGSGNVYVTGRSVSSGTNFDYTTIKYSSAGDTLWVRRYDGPVNSDDYAYALAVDASGNVYVTGYSVGSGSALDYATIKYKSNGDTAWVKRYNGPGNSSDEAYALAIDGSGNVYVTGYTDSAGGINWNYATIKYSACVAKPGDANASDTYTLADPIAIVNYVFNKPGCSPLPLCWLSGLLCRGDWDGSTTVTLGDAIRGVNFIFNKPGGPWNALPVGVCCL